MELTEGKVAVITGAANGIGLALAERFARSGLDVVLADVQEDRLAEATTRIEAMGVHALAVRCDVSSAAQVGELAQATLDRFTGAGRSCPTWSGAGTL